VNVGAGVEMEMDKERMWSARPRTRSMWAKSWEES